MKEGLFGKYSEDAIYGLVECGELGLRSVLGKTRMKKLDIQYWIKNVSMALILIRFDQLVRVMHIRNAIHLFITNDDGKECSFCLLCFRFVSVLFAWG